MSPRLVFATLLLATLAATPSCAFSSGAPNSPDVCQSLTPKHFVNAQTTPSPYAIAVSKTSTKSNEPVLVTIEGADFVGFIMQARVNGKPVGKFDVSGSNGLAQTTRCSGKKDTVTHKSNAKQSKLTVKWTAPKNPPNDLDVTFTATVLESGFVFWVSQKSPVLKVSAAVPV